MMMKLRILCLIMLTLGALSSKAQMRFFGLDASNKLVVLRNWNSDTTHLGTYYFMLDGTKYDLSSLSIYFGWLDCPSNYSLGLTGLPMGNSGCLSLHNSQWENWPGDQSGLIDFVQWNGTSTCSVEDTAVAKGYWTKGEYVKSIPPLYYQGGCCDRGASYWQKFNMPKVGMRFVCVNPTNNQISIKNTGASNLDLSLFTICVDGTCYDSLQNAPWQVAKGSLNVPKDDTLVLSGVTLNPQAGSIAFFFPLNFKDTSNLIEYFQWGYDLPQNQLDTLAAMCGRWDTSQYVQIAPGDSTLYMGDLSDAQRGAPYWKSSYERLGMVDLKLTAIDPGKGKASFVNHGSIPIHPADAVVYFNTDSVGLTNPSLVSVSAPDPIYPGDSVHFSYTADTAIHELGLFRRNYAFDTTGIMDMAAWGQNASLANLGIQKGWWDNTPLLHDSDNWYTYAGNGSFAQRTSAYWQVFKPVFIGIKRITSVANAPIFPNPSTGWISVPAAWIGQPFTVYSAEGKPVFYANLKSPLVDLQHLAPGLYYWTLPNGETGKLVISQ